MLEYDTGLKEVLTVIRLPQVTFKCYMYMSQNILLPSESIQKRIERKSHVHINRKHDFTLRIFSVENCQLNKIRDYVTNVKDAKQQRRYTEQAMEARSYSCEANEEYTVLDNFKPT